VCAFLPGGTPIRTAAPSAGEAHPRASNAIPAGRARNRYVEIAVAY
jgi:outer membrane protein OmpA-like peptidoglycan-associated protein